MKRPKEVEKEVNSDHLVPISLIYGELEEGAKVRSQGSLQV